MQQFIMTIPAHLQAAYASNEVAVFGSIIKNVTTGQIAGHLQQSASLTNMMSLIGSSPIGAVATLADVGAQAVTIAQNEQIKQALGALQHLQIANLALTGLGIGVSVAGFAIMSAKIDKVNRRLDGIAEQLDRIAMGLDDMKMEYIRADLDRLRTACEQADEAWTLLNPLPQWHAAAETLHHLQNAFGRRAARMLAIADAAPDLRDCCVDAFVLAGSTRVAVRLAMNEMPAAIATSRSYATELQRLTGELGAENFLSERLKATKLGMAPQEHLAAFELHRPDAERRSTFLREREVLAATQALTIAQLHASGISGRDWLEQARTTQEPFICLSAER
jgi:hypothetical protein